MQRTGVAAGAEIEASRETAREMERYQVLGALLKLAQITMSGAWDTARRVSSKSYFLQVSHRGAGCMWTESIDRVCRTGFPSNKADTGRPFEAIGFHDTEKDRPAYTAIHGMVGSLSHGQNVVVDDKEAIIR